MPFADAMRLATIIALGWLALAVVVALGLHLLLFSRCRRCGRMARLSHTSRLCYNCWRYLLK